MVCSLSNIVERDHKVNWMRQFIFRIHPSGAESIQSTSPEQRLFGVRIPPSPRFEWINYDHSWRLAAAFGKQTECITVFVLRLVIHSHTCLIDGNRK